MKMQVDARTRSGRQVLDEKTRSAGRPLVLVGTLALSALALAHTGASGVVKERMDLMESIGDSMEVLVSMFKGDTAYDSARVKTEAAKIQEHGGERMVSLFPEGSLEEPSEALPEIWENWEEFEVLAMQLQQYSDALVQAADNPSQPGMMSGRGGGQGVPGSRGGMMGGGQGMMMGGQRGAGPDAEHLAQMPPQAAFMHLADTCNSCHTKFRAEKE